MSIPVKNSIYLIFLSFGFLNAQVDGSLLLGLTNATAIEMNTVVNPVEGSLLYNSDDNQVYVYNGVQWSTLKKENVYMGVLIINGTGNINVSGLPFRPSQVSFSAHANIESLNINSDNGVGNNNNGIANSYGSMNGFARNNGGSTTQQVIYVGGSGNSINDISRYSSSGHCIGIRYGNQNGDNLGITSASLSSFNTNGFTINVDSHVDNLVVLYQAYE
ncbi:MAG: hypothetical protein WBB27_16160 [Maribacter sp.]